MRAHQPGSTPIDIPETVRTPPILPHPRLRRSGADQSAGKGARKSNRPDDSGAFFWSNRIRRSRVHLGNVGLIGSAVFTAEKTIDRETIASLTLGRYNQNAEEFWHSCLQLFGWFADDYRASERYFDCPC